MNAFILDELWTISTLNFKTLLWISVYDTCFGDSKHADEGGHLGNFKSVCIMFGIFQNDTRSLTNLNLLNFNWGSHILNIVYVHLLVIKIFFLLLLHKSYQVFLLVSYTFV